MALSKKEKLAILHTLMVIASADGHKGSPENNLLYEIASKALEFSLEDFLGGIIQEAISMKEEEVAILVSNLDNQKKLMIHRLLADMACVDGEINKQEVIILHHMVNLYGLPKINTPL